MEAAAGKRQAAVHNPPVDSAADTAEEVVARNSGVDNPVDYIAITVRIPVAVVPAEVRWEYDPRSPAGREVSRINLIYISFFD